MRKAIAVMGTVLALALCAAGVATAVGNSPPPAVVPDRPSVHLVESPDTTVPRGPAPEFPGKPNRDRVPEHNGQRMTHTTGTLVRFR